MADAVQVCVGGDQVESEPGLQGRPQKPERFPSVVELVKGDIALGSQLRVTGTPTFFVNGVKLPGLRPEFFNAAIEYELTQAGGK